MERLRNIVIRVEVDTNKTTHSVEFRLGEYDEDETTEELFKRAQEWAEERMP